MLKEKTWLMFLWSYKKKKRVYFTRNTRLYWGIEKRKSIKIIFFEESTEEPIEIKSPKEDKKYDRLVW